MPVLNHGSQRMAESVPNLDSKAVATVKFAELKISAGAAAPAPASSRAGSISTGFLLSPRQNFSRLRLRLQQAANKALSSGARQSDASNHSQSSFEESTDSSATITSDGEANLKPDNDEKATLSIADVSRRTTAWDESVDLDRTTDQLSVTAGNTAAIKTIFSKVDDRKASSLFGVIDLTRALGNSATGSDKPVLALDLDETLIHSSLIPRRASDFWIEVVQNNDVRTREVFWVYKRPGVDEFLKEICKHYKVYIFTAGIREYATQILDRLDPTGTIFAGRYYRDECTEIRGQGTYAKDLVKVCPNLDRIILVDNTPACFSLQPSNGLQIKSWYTDTADRHLQRLQDFLVSVAGAKDLRLAIPEWNMN